VPLRSRVTALGGCVAIVALGNFGKAAEVLQSRLPAVRTLSPSCRLALARSLTTPRMLDSTFQVPPRQRISCYRRCS
jgi:hypothetical protein